MSHASVIVALDENIINIQKAVEYQMLPFDENGEWFRNGTRWDWYQIGGRYTGKFFGQDIIRRKELTDEAIEEFNIQKANKCWNAWLKAEIKDDFIRSYVYGLDENETLESLVEKYKKLKIHAYAFLKNRRWYENSRLGFFGTPTRTECERTDGHIGTCLHKNEELDAQIVTFNYEEDGWGNNYFDKFIKDLSPETILVNVDYHV